ncbi:MAG: DUF697 domain-containing protein [Planctomycetales bacterium]|nr:DUF697 domain-containing protein [Planctomycetales bacterium]
MKIRFSSGLLILVSLAFLGWLLVTLPPRLLELYLRANEIAPWLGWTLIGLVGSGGVLLLGSSLWIIGGVIRGSRRKRQRRERGAKNPSQLSTTDQQRELKQNLEAVQDLGEAREVAPELRDHLRALADRVQEKQRDQKLEIVAFGTISSGKSSLLNALAGRDVFASDVKGGTTVRRNEIAWTGQDRVTLVDTPGLGEIDGAERVRIAAEAAKDADLVVVVVDGPLRESEHNLLERLGEMEKRVLVCLNKSDWYDQRDQESLIGQLQRQTDRFVQPADIVAVRSQPTERTRVRVLPDGTEQVEQVEIAPDIAPLAERMMRIVRKDGAELLLANLLLQSRGLVDDARRRVQASLDQRAGEIIDRYTWAAGGAAAISPLPLMDLAAGSALTAKMAIDLGRVYRQEMDTDTAVTLLAQLGKNLISILGVSAATPLVATGLASTMKTVPGIGTLAGGLLQGVVQAFVTRWIGAVFVGYYQNEMVRENKSALASLARKEWERLTTIDELRRFIRDARANLRGRGGEERDEDEDA